MVFSVSVLKISEADMIKSKCYAHSIPIDHFKT